MNGTETDALLEDYATWMRSWGASTRTVSLRTRTARGRLEEWGIGGFNRRNLQAWIGRENLSKSSRSTYFNHMRCFCSWLFLEGWIDEDPLASGDIKRAKPGRTQPRPLSEDEAKRVMSAATGRLRAWLLLATLAGLRAHEIAKIRGEDVNDDYIFVHGKGDTDAMIPTHPALWALAQNYPRQGWWFPSPSGGPIAMETVSSQVGRHFRSLGVHGSVHRARHLYATQLLRRGANVRTVQKLMRHASLATTALYCAVDEDEMRAAVNLLGHETTTDDDEDQP